MHYIGSICAYLVGGFDAAIKILLVTMLYVYITGWCKVLFFHKMNKLVSVRGIIRNVGYLIIVSLSVFIDKIMVGNNAIRILVIYFFIAHEGLVILKNWCKMGLPLPQKIYDTLEQLTGEEEKDEETIDS